MSHQETRPCQTSKTSKSRPSFICDGTREGCFPVAMQISRFVVRYQGLSDKEVLSADFKLSDAQELVARKLGFESWPTLRKGIETITASAPSSGPTATIMAAEPQLLVADIELACRSYVEKLGFKSRVSYGEPPFYAEVCRDDGRLNLRKLGGGTGIRTRAPGFPDGRFSKPLVSATHPPLRRSGARECAPWPTGVLMGRPGACQSPTAAACARTWLYGSASPGTFMPRWTAGRAPTSASHRSTFG